MLNVILLNVFMLNVILLNGIMLNAIILNVIMLNAIMVNGIMRYVMAVPEDQTGAEISFGPFLSSVWKILIKILNWPKINTNPLQPQPSESSNVKICVSKLQKQTKLQKFALYIKICDFWYKIQDKYIAQSTLVDFDKSWHKTK